MNIACTKTGTVLNPDSALWPDKEHCELLRYQLLVMGGTWEEHGHLLSLWSPKVCCLGKAETALMD